MSLLYGWKIGCGGRHRLMYSVRGGVDRCFMRLRCADLDAAVEFVDHAGYVSAGFAIGRNTVIAIDGRGAGVVSRQRQRHVVAIAREQSIQISRAACDVLRGLKAVCDSEAARGGRHQLHEPLGARMADRACVSAAFGLDDAGQQVHVEVVIFACAREDLGEIGLTQLLIERLLRSRSRSGLNRRWRSGELLDSSDGFRGKFDVVVFAGVEEETNPGPRRRMVVAVDRETVGKRNALGAVQRGREEKKRCNHYRE